MTFSGLFSGDGGKSGAVARKVIYAYRAGKVTGSFSENLTGIFSETVAGPEIIIRAQAESLFLPLFLRLFIRFMPETLFIRFLNPCFFLRLLFLG